MAINKENIKTIEDAFKFADKVFQKVNYEDEFSEKAVYKGGKLPKKRVEYKRPAVVNDKEYSDVHVQIQIQLKNQLEKKGWKVEFEASHRKDRSRIDVVAIKEKEQYYIEVKPYATAQSCIREALGQLLEYWYYKKMDSYYKATKLIIAGPVKDIKADKIFLNCICKNHKIPVEYWQIEI